MIKSKKSPNISSNYSFWSWHKKGRASLYRQILGNKSSAFSFFVCVFAPPLFVLWREWERKRERERERKPEVEGHILFLSHQGSLEGFTVRILRESVSIQRGKRFEMKCLLVYYRNISRRLVYVRYNIYHFNFKFLMPNTWKESENVRLTWEVYA